MLANAQGIVIIPDLVKGGFVLGVRHGRGIVMVRDERGFWRPPSFVTLTGGSVGWQIGLQVTDIVLVFKTRSSVQGLLRGKFTLGADAAAAAGPVGREAAAATDTQLLAEIFTWSRSRGLFAGVSLDGSALQIDACGQCRILRRRERHRSHPSHSRAAFGDRPDAAGRVLHRHARRVALGRAPCGSANAGPHACRGRPHACRGRPAPPATAGVADLQSMRQQLSAASLRLHVILDANWRTYLDMPPEIYAGDRPPNVQNLQQTLGRFDAVARDPQYALLAQREEFRATHQWLTQYVAASTATARNTPTLALPAPPK